MRIGGAEALANTKGGVTMDINNVVHYLESLQEK